MTRSPSCWKALRTAWRTSERMPSMPDDGGGGDGAEVGFVVEGGVAGDDGCVECAAGVGDALDGLAELVGRRAGVRGWRS